MAADSERTDLDLLRAFEPVVRFTNGEFFYPVSVAQYVRSEERRVGKECLL